MEMKGLTILKTTNDIEKSVDGQGRITRGTFVKGGETYSNATLVGNAVYSSDGSYLGLVTEGTWTAA